MVHRKRLSCLLVATLMPTAQVGAFTSPPFVTPALGEVYEQSNSQLFAFDWQKTFENAFSFGSNAERVEDRKVAEARNELKQKLLRICALPESKQKRSQVEDTIQALADLNPTTDAATNPLLQKQWDLVWTTEKEINFFLEKGWATEIGQTIYGSILQNIIPFVNGGSLGVEGKIEADKNNPLRTIFEFDSATLDLAKWGSYNLPPVGKGWFDTIYLDDELRVDENSRNDILICVPKN